MRVLNNQSVGDLSKVMRKALYVVDYAFHKNAEEFVVVEIKKGIPLSEDGLLSHGSFACELAPEGTRAIIQEAQAFLGPDFKVGIKENLIHVEYCGYI